MTGQVQVGDVLKIKISSMRISENAEKTDIKAKRSTASMLSTFPTLQQGTTSNLFCEREGNSRDPHDSYRKN